MDNTAEIKTDLKVLAKKLSIMSDPNRLNTITMTELYDTAYKPRLPLIKDLLYPGTYIFAGSPKVGKSFFMLQLAYHISKGLPLWNFEVRKGKVLYLALEDTYARLQKRLFAMFGEEATDNLMLGLKAGNIEENLLDQLRAFMNDNPDTALIIIDTLQKVREGCGDKYSYAGDYDIVSSLKKFTDEFGITLIIVHHTRKQQADDSFDMISGTNGLLGAADGAFMLQKPQRDNSTFRLSVTGRDIYDRCVLLCRNYTTLLFEILSVSDGVYHEDEPNPLLEKVNAFLLSAGNVWTGSPTELAGVLGLDMKANKLTLKLNVSAEEMLERYGIEYENIRTHDGRKITLKLKSDASA